MRKWNRSLLIMGLALLAIAFLLLSNRLISTTMDDAGLGLGAYVLMLAALVLFEAWYTRRRREVLFERPRPLSAAEFKESLGNPYPNIQSPTVAFPGTVTIIVTDPMAKQALIEASESIHDCAVLDSDVPGLNFLMHLHCNPDLIEVRDAASKAPLGGIGPIAPTFRNN